MVEADRFLEDVVARGVRHAEDVFVLGERVGKSG